MVLLLIEHVSFGQAVLLCSTPSHWGTSKSGFRIRRLCTVGL